jgi:hypothetical protein
MTQVSLMKLLNNACLSLQRLLVPPDLRPVVARRAVEARWKRSGARIAVYWSTTYDVTYVI